MKKYFLQKILPSIIYCGLLITLNYSYSKAEISNSRGCNTCKPICAPSFSCPPSSIAFLSCTGNNNQQCFDEVCANEVCNCPATLSRDSFGVAIIRGGDARQVYQTMGYAQAQDRLFQIFWFTAIANGRLASLIGPGGVPNDVFQRSTIYTDEEVLDQFAQFSACSRLIYEAYIDGLNQYVNEVNASAGTLLPYEFKLLNIAVVPLFTITDILRENMWLLQQFDPSSNPTYQLSNQTLLQNVLIPRFGDAAFDVFNDVRPDVSKLHLVDTVVPNNDCRKQCCTRKVGPPSATSSVVTLNKSSKKFSFDVPQSYAKAAQEQCEVFEAIAKTFKEIGVDLHTASWSYGAVIGPKKSASGLPMILGASQASNQRPSTFWEVYVDSQPANAHYLQMSLPGFPSFSLFHTSALWAGTGHVGHLPANDYLYESIDNRVFSHVAVIEVAGQPSILLDVYRSTSGGFVVNPSVDANTILTLRTVFYGRQLLAYDAHLRMVLARTLGEYLEIIRCKNIMTDLTNFEVEVVSQTGTIGAIHMGAWTELDPSVDRRIPLGVFGNNAPVYNDSIIRESLIDLNTEQGFYANHNTLFKQGLQAPGRAYNAEQRVWWLIDYIKSIPKLTFEDLRRANLHVNTERLFAGFDNTSINMRADLFVPLFKCRFFQAIQSEPITPDRQQTLNLLCDYQGYWVSGDENEIVNGNDVDPRWILANLWLLCVVREFTNPAVTPDPQLTIPPSTMANPFPIPASGPYGGPYEVLEALSDTVARILGTACDNTVYYGVANWLALTGETNANTIILSCLDEALTLLGGFANIDNWGAGKRPVYNFPPVFAGLTPFIPTALVNGAARGTEMMIAEYSPKCGLIRVESILGVGESGEFLGTPPAQADVNEHVQDQLPFYEADILKPFQPFCNILTCKLRCGKCACV